MIVVEERKEYEGIYFRKPRFYFEISRFYFRKPRWGAITGLRWRIRDYGRKFRRVLFYVLRRGLLTERELTDLIRKWKYDIDRAWERIFFELIYYLRKKRISERDIAYIKNIWER